MPQAIINGRTVFIPSTTTASKIRETAGIEPSRNLIRRTREGNYLVPAIAPITVEDGDSFIDAPARVKGRAGR